MLGKSGKAFSRSIVHYLDADVEAEESSRGERVQSGIDPPVTLAAIRQVALELDKIEIEFKNFKEETCRSMTVFEQKVYSKLACLTQKIEAIEILKGILSKKSKKLRIRVSQLRLRH